MRQFYNIRLQKTCNKSQQMQQGKAYSGGITTDLVDKE
jgi:hypothetical protein